MAVNTGLATSQTTTVTHELAKLLADTYFLYLKTQNFHWNVTSSQFHSLHALFELQYEELAEAIDTIAERIRALGHVAPASFQQFSKLAEIKEVSEVPTDIDMLTQLLADHELLCRNLRKSVEVAQKAGDEGTADSLIARLLAHEKTAWMLRSSL